jgi:hypothetical protein
MMKRGTPFFIALVMLLFGTSRIRAQSDSLARDSSSHYSEHAVETKSRPFFIWIDGGLGYSLDVGALAQPTATPGANYSNGGLIGLIRVRGSRSNFISVGLESGWQHLSSVTQQNAQAAGYGATNITATLNAIPVMGIVTIQDYGIQLHGSVGFYRLISTATLFGNTITSGEWDMAFMVGVGAQIDLGATYKLLPELRFTRINDQRRSLIAFMLRLELPKWQPF